jgi:hypothetical protein
MFGRMNLRIMPNLLLAVLVTCGIPVHAATLPDCSPLCGAWELDQAASDPLESTLDAAFAKFKEPRPKDKSEFRVGNIESMSRAADEDALGPLYERPHADELREELLRTLTAPGKLELSIEGKDFLVAIDGRKPTRLSPGVPHSRVDYYGTAEITMEWRQQQLIVTERYDRKRQYTRNLAMRHSDGAMVYTQQITRQGIPALTLRSIYRRPL